MLAIISGLLLAFIVVSTITENIIYANKINELKRDTIFDEINSSVSKKYYYKNNRLDAYTKNDDYLYPGKSFDLILSVDSSVYVPLVHDILSYTVGGHASICGFKFSDHNLNVSETDVLETALNDEMDKAQATNRGYWNEMFRTSFIGLRVNLTDYQYKIVYNEIASLIDDPYNYTFLFNTNSSSYCSDLISKGFRKVGINLNFDGGPTTVMDIIASSYTKPFLYKEVINGVSYYYSC